MATPRPLALALALLAACGGDKPEQVPDPSTTTSTSTPTTDRTTTPTEICNGLDDDGDGEVDEGLTCTSTCALDLPAGGPVDVAPVCVRDLPQGNGFGPSQPTSVARLDGDDLPDLLVTNTALQATGPQPFQVLDVTGRTVLTLGGLKLEQSVVVDADGDGEREIYIVDSPLVNDDSRQVQRIAPDGSVVWTSPRLFNDGAHGLYSEGAGVPTAGDVDGDGEVELVFGEWILDAGDGHLERQLRGFSFQGWAEETPATGGPVLADLDGDGLAEILYGAWVYAQGEQPWWAAPVDLDWPNWTYPMALQLDGSPELEVVFVNDGALNVFAYDGTPLWRTVVDGSGGGTEPCAGDFDGDGAPEIGVSTDQQTQIVDGDGTLVWSVPSYGGAGCTAVDLDGDGADELIFVAYDGLHVLEGPSGIEVFADPGVNGWENTVPVVADIDGDGKAELLVSSAAWGYGGLNGLRLYDSPLWPGVGSTWSLSDFSEARLTDDSLVLTGDPGWMHRRAARTPGRAGPSPVLQAEIADVCAADCDADGLVRLAVSVRNVGEVDAEAGLVLEVLDRSDAGVAVVAEVTLPAVPSGAALDAIAVERSRAPGTDAGSAHRQRRRLAWRRGGWTSPG
ncbi:MAG: VCBS repeat-containing protein [Myxococcota bacterium]